MQESTILKLLVTATGTFTSLVFGGLDLLFKILILFIVLDYATGLMKGLVTKSLSSATGWNGLMRKTGIFIAVIVAHQMDKVAGTQIVRNAVIFFFMTNEGISLIENLFLIGVPIPKIMIRTLKTWKETSDID